MLKEDALCARGRLLAGGIAGMASRAAVAPFERMRTMFMADPNQKTMHGISVLFTLASLHLSSFPLYYEVNFQKIELYESHGRATIVWPHTAVVMAQ